MAAPKKCIKCEEVKSLDEFYKVTKNKDGYAYTCKECIRRQHQQNYHDNKESRLEQKKQYYQHNRESILEKKKQYHYGNEKNKKYYIIYIYY